MWVIRPTQNKLVVFDDQYNKVHTFPVFVTSCLFKKTGHRTISSARSIQPTPLYIIFNVHFNMIPKSKPNPSKASFPFKFVDKILYSFPVSLSFPYASKPSWRFSSCNFTNEYLLCFRVSYSLSKRMGCLKRMTTKDNIENKYTARANTPNDLINWNSYVTFISESHITSVFLNSQALLCNQGQREKKQDLWILFLLTFCNSSEKNVYNHHTTHKR
jgi:hypothetical protein